MDVFLSGIEPGTRRSFHLSKIFRDFENGTEFLDQKHQSYTLNNDKKCTISAKKTENYSFLFPLKVYFFPLHCHIRTITKDSTKLSTTLCKITLLQQCARALSSVSGNNNAIRTITIQTNKLGTNLPNGPSV